MKPRIFNGTVWTEFETQAEHDAYVASNSPTPDLSVFYRNERAEILGKAVVRDLFVTLQNQNLTQAEEGDLLNRVFPVFCALGDGFLRGARVIANNLSVAGQLTLARKNYLLARIDEAITALG